VPFNLKICDNQVSNTHLGIECKNALDLTDLKSNIIGSAAYGLICRSGTTMPEQIRHENRWTGSYFNWGAFYDGTPGFQFKYDDTNTIQDDDPPSWSPFDWFMPESGASNGNCTSSSAIPSITGKERQYVGGAIAPDTATANWEARRILLYKLMRYPELAENDDNAEDYLDDNAAANTSPWQFARAEWLFDQAYKFSSSSATQIETLSPQYRAFADSIIAYDLLQAQDTTTYDFSIAQNRANAFAQLCGKTESIDQQRASLEPTVQQALQTALTYAQGLPTAKAYESNLKNVLLIAIRYALGDSLTPADTTTLRNIANQCPQYGGMSVFRAPHWLSHEESVAYIMKDWVAQCGGERSAQNPSNEQVGEATVQVLPNPANSQVRFVFPENTAAARWQISDIAGRIVRQGNTAGTVLEIDTTSWKAGIYFLTCQGSNGKTLATKFTVTH
jgi:hypothetical protein